MQSVAAGRLHEAFGVRDPAPRAGTAAPDSDLVQVVRSAQSGDRSAFGTLYERYGRMVHGLLLSHADRDDVHDLVQDVFISALARIATLRQPEAFGAWLGTIARNRARMHHRGRRPTEPLTEEIHAGGSTPDAALGAAEVLEALRRLPERFREPLVLRLVEGLSGEEIAAQTGLSHGTVRVYLHHGMAQLRELLGGNDG
jgi:RNA polymerase sigma-70 factor, ECF subfamily